MLRKSEKNNNAIPQRRLRASRLSATQSSTDVSGNGGGDGETDGVNAFTEPPLGDSIIVTGQKIEESPTVKIKKELGVFSKGKSSENSLDDSRLQKYVEGLKDRKEVEGSTVLSDIRTPLITRENVVSKVGKANSKKNRKKHQLLNRPKDFLDISKKLALGSLSPSDSPAQPVASSADEGVENNDYCSCCGMTGMFLCCESCPKSYHFHCINPPIDPNNLPEFWYCKECIKKKAKREALSANSLTVNVGIFSKLFDNILFQDPISFQVPKEIIESFEHISSDRLGDFNDDSFKPAKTYKQLIKEYDDPLNGVYDANGNPYFCYKCGESGLNNEIINCDYCDLSWHLDCVDPPLASVKKLGTKWKCPAHVDDLYKPIRKFKDQSVVPISSIENFENVMGKLPINANIQINNIEDKLDALKNQIKTLHGNNHDTSKLKFSNLTFQINEEDIVLNFIKQNKVKRLNENTKNIETLMKLQPTLKDYVLSLSQLSNRNILDNEFRVSNLQKLLKVADEELKVELNEFSKEELRELLLVKKMLLRKGKDKVMQFLKSS